MMRRLLANIRKGQLAGQNGAGRLVRNQEARIRHERDAIGNYLDG